MPPLTYFEMVRRMLEHYLDGIVKDAGQPGIRVTQLYFGDAPLVPSGISSGPAGPGTCSCGRYWDKPSIVSQWQFNPVTHVLDLRPHKEDSGHVTSGELQLWEIELQSRCTNSACPHFRACANDGGNGARAA